MKTIALYVTRLFLTRFAICLIGFTALVQLLDLVEVGRDLEVRSNTGVGIALYYIILRLPSIILQMLPISVLMGTLLTLLNLANTNEIIALKSLGVSFYKTLACLLPIGLVVAVCYFLLGDQVAPRLDRHLQNWWFDTTPLSEQEKPERAWVRDGNNVVEIDRIASKGRELFGIMLYLRDDQAITVERLDADRAVYENDQWQLYGVRQHYADISGTQSAPVEEISEMAWDTTLTPENLAEIALPPRVFTFSQLSKIISGKWAGKRANYYYSTLLHKKIAGPISLLLMILIAAPVAQTIRRHGSGGLALILGIGIGFAYFIADGLVLTLGEGGILPGFLAAWLPTLIFASIGGAILLNREH